MASPLGAQPPIRSADHPRAAAPHVLARLAWLAIPFLVAAAGLHPSASPPAPQVYTGYDPNAPWRKPAEDRIEQIRKGDLRVQVRDAAGNPVSSATVHVRMLRHSFIFGSEVEPGIILDPVRQDAVLYRNAVPMMFNTVVFGHHLEWGPWEAPNLHLESLQATAWLESLGLAQRGHALIWPDCTRGAPDVCGLMKNPDALRKRIAGHITDEASSLKGHILEWNVVNEPYLNHPIVDRLGKKAMTKWFKLARQADPVATLYLNEIGALEDYGGNEDRRLFLEDAVAYLKKHRAPIGGIGLESHFAWPPPAIEDMLVTLDRLGALGVVLEGTEFDVDAPDESLQSQFTYDYLTMMFSHPSVVGVLVWGFWEGSIDQPNSALLSLNWSVKPAGQVWLDLTQNVWRTDVQGPTSAQGEFTTRGFLGDYEITADAAGMSGKVTTTLPKSGSVVQITLN